MVILRAAEAEQGAAEGGDTASLTSKRRLTESAVGSVSVLLGGVVAVWRPSVPTVWFDESVYQRAGWAYVHGDLHLNPEHPPLAKLIYGTWMLLSTPSVDNMRVLAGIVTIMTAAIMWWWASTEVRVSLAWLPAAGWLLCAHQFEGEARLDRLASLDVVMVMFLTCGMATAWRWWRTRQVWLAVTSGLMFGCAVSSKIVAVLFIPALAALLLRRGTLRSRVMAAAGFVVAFAVVQAAVWTPFGGVEGFRHMVRYQDAHNQHGHVTLVGDRVVRFGTPLDTLLQAFYGLGLAGTVFVVVGCALAACTLRIALWTTLGLGTLATVAFFALVSNVVLPHYYLDWVWGPTFLAGLAVAHVLSQGRPSWSTRVAVVVVVGALVLSAVPTVVRVVRSRPSEFAAVGMLLRTRPGSTLVGGVSPAIHLRTYIPHPRFEAGSTPIDTVVVGNDARSPLTAQVRRLVSQPPSCVQVIRLKDVTVYTTLPGSTLRSYRPRPELTCEPTP